MKKSYFQKVLSIVLIAIMCITFVACSQSGSSSSDSTETTVSTDSNSSSENSGNAGTPDKPDGEAPDGQPGERPDGEGPGGNPPGGGGFGGGSSNADIDYTGAVEIAAADSQDGNTYASMRGFPGDRNGMQPAFGQANYETADSASEIITSGIVCTAKTLTADYSNAVTIEMTDSENQVKISESGTYIITGTCSDGNITVKKDTTGVVLILKDLDLTSTTGATVSVNKGAETQLVIEGTVTLKDAENPEDENSTDEEIADAFDGAAIKVKDGANVYLTGKGTLIINAICKNGIKSGDEAGTCLVIDGPDITINAVNDAINAGYDLTILGGTITITATDDAIHADRILTIGSDNTSGPVITIKNCTEGLEGTVVNVFSGNITLTASDDGINAANKEATYASELAYSINITGGTVSVSSSGDGLDSNGNINLTGGTITIKSASDGGEAGIDFDG